MFKQAPPTEQEQFAGDQADEQGQSEATTPARRLPLYRMAQKLRDLDLMMQYPRLSKRERRRVVAPYVDKPPVPRGKPANPTAKKEPSQEEGEK